MQPRDTTGHESGPQSQQAEDTSLASTLPPLLTAHPAVRAVTFVGSRATNTATPVSDWDFAVDTDDIDALAPDLPRVLAPLHPLAQQWDPLGRHRTYMLMLPGAVKVDLIFTAPNIEQPPWTVAQDTLPRIDHHFWDWTIWLAAKDLTGKTELVAAELAKMHRHLLGPLGITTPSRSVPAAIAAYLTARDAVENHLGVTVARTLEREVLDKLHANGVRV